MLCRQFHSLLRKQSGCRFSHDRNRYLCKLNGTENLLPRIMFSAEPFSTDKSESTGFDLTLEVVTDVTKDKGALLENATSETLRRSGHGDDFSGGHIDRQWTGHCSMVFRHSLDFSIGFTANSSS